jgi:hypothetical protein
MAKRGRKSKAEELDVLRRYSDLSDSYFAVIKEALDSPRKDERHWAADHLKNAFVKMIPQDLTTKGKEITPAIIKIVAPDGTDIQALIKTV